ncbi:unnamed protein product [Penicillium discolor]
MPPNNVVKTKTSKVIKTPPKKVTKKKITKRKLVTAILYMQTHKLSFAEWEANIANLEALVQGEEYELPTLAISSLSISDVQSMLKLSFSLDNAEFRNQPPVDPPPSYVEWMNSEDNEALTRITLKNLLVCSHHHVTSHSDNVSNEIHINAGGRWWYGPVVHKGAKYDLIGRPDYSLWYGTKEDVAVSVVVVEAKAGVTATPGIPQVLGYMGCIHRRRKRLAKVNSMVYGVVSDGQYFAFLKINDDSQAME